MLNAIALEGSGSLNDLSDRVQPWQALQETEDVCETPQHVLMSPQLQSGPRTKTLLTDLFHTIIPYTAHINKTKCLPGKYLHCDFELWMPRHMQTFRLARWHNILTDWIQMNLIKCDFPWFILASCHIGHCISTSSHSFESKV